MSAKLEILAHLKNEIISRANEINSNNKLDEHLFHAITDYDDCADPDDADWVAHCEAHNLPIDHNSSDLVPL